MKFVSRIKGILTAPAQEWQEIEGEQTTPKAILLLYAGPFIALASLITFVSVLTGTYMDFATALQFALLQLVKPLVCIIVTAVVVNEVATTYDSEKNLSRAFQLVVYSCTPYLLLEVVISISWALSVLGIFQLYSLYLFWKGEKPMMKTPNNRRVVYIITAFTVFVVTNVLFEALFGMTHRIAYY